MQHALQRQAEPTYAGQGHQYWQSEAQIESLGVQGVGIKISDFKLVIDKRVYALDGRWGDLLNKIKWDLAKSVAKSAVGIQKGKLRVRHHRGRPADA